MKDVQVKICITSETKPVFYKATITHKALESNSSFHVK